MSRITYNKLVRDRIPEIISADGQRPTTRTLAPEEFTKALRQKLVEEAKEVLAARDEQELYKELADVQEVLDTLKPACQVDQTRLDAVQAERHTTRGGFRGRVFLETVEDAL